MSPEEYLSDLERRMREFEDRLKVLIEIIAGSRSMYDLNVDVGSLIEETV